MEQKVKKFKVGKQYSMCSVCDHDCVWTYEVVSRTDSTVVLQQVLKGETFGEQARFRIKRQLTDLRGAESVMPLGSYSMAPILSAE